MIAECKHCQSASRTNTDSNSYSRGGGGEEAAAAAVDGAGGWIYLVTRRWSAIRFLSGSDNEKVCCLLCASQNAYAGTGRAGGCACCLSCTSGGDVLRCQYKWRRQQQLCRLCLVTYAKV